MGGKAVADERPMEVDALTAACLLVRRELAGFDEGYVRGYYEDTDLCMRIKEQGYALVLHRGSVLIHYHGMSMGKNQTKTEEAQARNKKLFLERWGNKLESLVYLASEKELTGKDLRCKGVLAADELAGQWPISRRLL
jgi:GT2 family glycosyltransferase